MPADSAGVTLGGDCVFLGFPYGGGWRARFSEGEFWMPYVKHCTVSAFNLGEMGDKKIWVLDGINNAGFSGGPVMFGTGPQQKIFAVISGYILEPTDVIVSAPSKRAPVKPVPPERRNPQTEKEVEHPKEAVNLNSGFILAYHISYAIDAIHKSPIGPQRKVK